MYLLTPHAPLCPLQCCRKGDAAGGIPEVHMQVPQDNVQGDHQQNIPKFGFLTTMVTGHYLASVSA